MLQATVCSISLTTLQLEVQPGLSFGNRNLAANAGFVAICGNAIVIGFGGHGDFQPIRSIFPRGSEAVPIVSNFGPAFLNEELLYRARDPCYVRRRAPFYTNSFNNLTVSTAPFSGSSAVFAMPDTTLVML